MYQMLQLDHKQPSLYRWLLTKRSVLRKNSRLPCNYFNWVHRLQKLTFMLQSAHQKTLRVALQFGSLAAQLSGSSDTADHPSGWRLFTHCQICTLLLQQKLLGPQWWVKIIVIYFFCFMLSITMNRSGEVLIDSDIDITIIFSKY
jgi:hypothetical protein